MKSTAGYLINSIRLIIFVTALSLCSPRSGATQDVLTQHNDNARTGANLSETILTPVNVKQPKSFGRLYSRDVRGFIYAQPLYATHVDVLKNGTKFMNLIIVATCQNYVYAFDADSTDPDSDHGIVWKQGQLESAGLPKQFGFDIAHPDKLICPITTWPMGITSTPVIDLTTNRLYLVVRRHSDGTHHLYVLDLRTGEKLSSTEITYAVVEPGKPSIPFVPSMHLNRPGLLLLNGKIYIGFGSLCDKGPSHGWLFSYDAVTLQQKGVFCVSPMAVEEQVSGGIWQSGNGITADSAGNVFAMTGNGEHDPTKQSYGSSFLQFQTGGTPNDLQLVGYFAPKNQEQLSKGDVDLGSGGAVMLPGSKLIGGGKQGRYYVLDPLTAFGAVPVKMNLSQDVLAADGFEGFQVFINTHHDTSTVTNPKTLSTPPGCSKTLDHCANFPQVQEEDNPSQVNCARQYALKKNLIIPRECYGFNQYYGPNIHGGPLYWEPNATLLGGGPPADGLIYGTAEKDFIKSFKYSKGGTPVDFGTPFKISSVRATDGMPGGMLSLSANGDHDGIVWASFPSKDNTFFIAPGRLLALDAITLETLWSDEDPNVRFAKFCPPTIAGGKVFRAAFGKLGLSPFDNGRLVVYGLCSASMPCKKPYKKSFFKRLFCFL